VSGRLRVLGVGIDAVDRAAALERMSARLDEPRAPLFHVVTANPEIVMLARRDARMAAAVEEAGLVAPDGIGVALAMRLLGAKGQERTPGIELAEGLAGALAKRRGSLFLYGAAPGVAERAAERLAAEHPGLVIAGCRHGYLTGTEADEAEEAIAAARPDALFVALGAPRQELWIAERARRLPVRIAIGVGGAFDVWSGGLRRAHPVWRRLGLEWLYRILQRPKRLLRAGALVRFAGAAVWEGITGRGRVNGG